MTMTGGFDAQASRFVARNWAEVTCDEHAEWIAQKAREPGWWQWARDYATTAHPINCGRTPFSTACELVLAAATT